MPELFKPSVAKPLPGHAEVIDHDGRPHVRIPGKTGGLFPLTADGAKYLRPSTKWAADVVLANGTRKRVRFSPNKDAATAMLAKLVAKIELEKAGVVDRFADHRRRPLADHVAAWEQTVSRSTTGSSKEQQ